MKQGVLGEQFFNSQMVFFLPLCREQGGLPAFLEALQQQLLKLGQAADAFPGAHGGEIGHFVLHVGCFWCLEQGTQAVVLWG